MPVKSSAGTARLRSVAWVSSRVRCARAAGIVIGELVALAARLRTSGGLSEGAMAVMWGFNFVHFGDGFGTRGGMKSWGSKGNQKGERNDMCIVCSAAVPCRSG
jgi:hypothetical protein